MLSHIPHFTASPTCIWAPSSSSAWHFIVLHYETLSQYTTLQAGHIDDHDLERYHLGMVEDEAELGPLEEHLLWCGGCVERAEAVAQYVDVVRAAACDLPD